MNVNITLDSSSALSQIKLKIYMDTVAAIVGHKIKLDSFDVDLAWRVAVMATDKLREEEKKFKVGLDRNRNET